MGARRSGEGAGRSGWLVLAGVLVVTAGSFARASGAGGTAVSTPSAAAGYPMAEADQPWAYQRFLVSSQADMDRLNQMGVDLGESLDKNPDGTMWAYAVVTAAQRDYLAKLGFRPGSIVQTSADAEKAQAEMARDVAQWRCARSDLAKSQHARVARSGRSRARRSRSRAPTTTRASSGTWLSVEAKSSAAQGNATVPPGSPGCPATGSNRCGIYGGSTTGACWGNPAGGASALSTAACPALAVDVLHRRREHLRPRLPDEHDGRPRRRASTSTTSCSIKLALKANDATAPHLPIMVKVASNYGSVQTRAGDDVHRHAAAVPGRASSTTSSRATRRPRTGRR